MNNDILKQRNIVTLKNKRRNETTTGIIDAIKYKTDEEVDELGELVDDYFEKGLFIGNPTYDDINNQRFKKLNPRDRVLVYVDDDTDELDSMYKDDSVFSLIKDNKGSIDYETYKKDTYTDKNDYWTKGTILSTDDPTNRILISFDDSQYPDKDYDSSYVRKLNPIADIEFLEILTTNKGKLTINNLKFNARKNKIMGEDAKNEIYSIEKTGDPSKINEIMKMEKLLKQKKEEQGSKTKYKLKWFYKTNYSGSKYFPLKVSNVERLSEGSKYSEIDRYTKLKEGDVVKYNDPSHPNNGLLARITRIKQDDTERRSYYDRKRLIYNIKFEPLETYIDATELKDYQQRYENMITTISNVSERKLLKFKYVEKTYYTDPIKTILKNKDKLNKFNSIITDNTLERLKKNTKFIPDYILAKFQPESKIRDMNKLIKPSDKHIYIISHSPVIKKRPSNLFFDMKVKEKNEVEIDIFVDLILFQSKMVTQEEWDNKSLTGKVGSILSEQVKNSYAGIFNCPNRFDKVKTIVNNIMNKRFFVDPEESETNLIKKSFHQTSKKIKAKKKEIEDLEEEKKSIIKEIKEFQKTGEEDEIVDKQIELGEIEEEIKKNKLILIELEGIMKQKGGKKTKRRKSKRHKRRKTRKNHK